MTIKLQVKQLSRLRRSYDLEWRSRSSDGEKYRPLVGLSSQQISGGENRTFFFPRWPSLWPRMKVKVDKIKHVMHFHVWGSHRAKFYYDDDFNSFRRIACEAGQTHRQTRRHALVYVNLFKVLIFWKEKNNINKAERQRYSVRAGEAHVRVRAVWFWMSDHALFEDDRFLSEGLHRLIGGKERVLGNLG